MKGTPPLPVPFETVVENGIADALRAALQALHEAYDAVPADIFEDGVDDAEREVRRETIRTLYFPDAAEDGLAPAP